MNSLLKSTAWEKCFHSFGLADATPRYLHDLQSKNLQRRADAEDHLRYEIYNSGDLWTAAIPVVAYLCEIIGQLDDDDFCLHWLYDVGTTIRWFHRSPQPVTSSLEAELVDWLAEADLGDLQYIASIDRWIDETQCESPSRGVPAQVAIYRLQTEVCNQLIALAPTVCSHLIAGLQVNKHQVLYAQALVPWAQCAKSWLPLARDVVVQCVASVTEISDLAIAILALGQLGGQLQSFETHPQPTIAALTLCFARDRGAADRIVSFLKTADFPTIESTWPTQFPTGAAATLTTVLTELKGRQLKGRQ